MHTGLNSCTSMFWSLSGRGRSGRIQLDLSRSRIEQIFWNGDIHRCIWVSEEVPEATATISIPATAQWRPLKAPLICWPQVRRFESRTATRPRAMAACPKRTARAAPARPTKDILQAVEAVTSNRDCFFVWDLIYFSSLCRAMSSPSASSPSTTAASLQPEQAPRTHPTAPFLRPLLASNAVALTPSPAIWTGANLHIPITHGIS